MLADFKDGSLPLVFRPDICIVGSGAAGITLAVELDRSGLDVLILAGGSRQYDDASQALYKSDVVGLNHNGIHNGRARIHGGTTTLWGGQALPLNAIDFEQRDWVPHSGWPFNLARLEPYYRRAERIMNLPAMTYDAAAWPPTMVGPPAFDSKLITPRISQFAKVPNFAVRYRRELAESLNVHVLLNLHATALETNPEGTRLDRIRCRSLQGRQATIEPRYAVVCCGAIETARLLLASNKVNPQGFGNSHDLVGRYFQDHLQTLGPTLEPRDRRRIHALFDSFTYRRRCYAPRFCSSEWLQREHRILNISFGVCHRTPADSAAESAKLLVRALRRRELRSKVPWALKNVLRRPHEAAFAAIQHTLYGKPVVSHRGPMSIGIQAEQQPNPLSRVYLSTERDRLDMCRAVLDWRVTELDRHSMRTIIKIATDEIHRLDLGRIDPSTFELSDDLSRMDEKIWDCAHHIGTARMHDDSRRGVVDRDCRLHDVKNVFIGSSAVFPTGGSSNPTLTIIALCVRIADLLKKECRAPTAIPMGAVAK
jgi:choline dehydrogenase-like flavoprotein